MLVGLVTMMDMVVMVGVVTIKMVVGMICMNEEI